MDKLEIDGIGYGYADPYTNKRGGGTGHGRGDGDGYGARYGDVIGGGDGSGSDVYGLFDGDGFGIGDEEIPPSEW